MAVETTTNEAVTALKRLPRRLDIGCRPVIGGELTTKSTWFAEVKILRIGRHNPLKVTVVVAFHQILRDHHVAVGMIGGSARLMELVAIHMAVPVKLGVLPCFSSRTVMDIKSRIV